MKKYNYDITIEAVNENDADIKMAALTTLAAKLKANELARLANVVKNDPVKTTLAKKYLGL